MTRGLTLLTALLATLAVALPASAAEGRVLKGVLVSVTPATVAVKDAKNVVLTCARADKSPSLDGYATGARVQVACVRIGSKLVLAKIRRLTAPAGSPAHDVEPTKFGGVVTALSDGSISLHDGDRDLTCSIGPASPATAGVKVGQHVNVACANGALVAIAPVVTTSGRAYEGAVSAVSPTSLTVHTDGGDLTCAVVDGSPSVAAVKVGDKVKFGCLGGVLKALVRADTTAPPTPPSPTDGHTVTVGGTLSALSSSSLTVHGEHGDVSCSVPGTAHLGDFHVGDRVGMACTDGVLVKVVKLTQ